MISFMSIFLVCSFLLLITSCMVISFSSCNFFTSLFAIFRFTFYVKYGIITLTLDSMYLKEENMKIFKIDTRKLFNKEQRLNQKKLSRKESLSIAIMAFTLSFLFPVVFCSNYSSTFDIIISLFLGNAFFFIGITFLLISLIIAVTEE